MPAPTRRVCNHLTALMTTQRTTTSTTYTDVTGALSPKFPAGAKYMMWVYAKVTVANTNQLGHFKLVLELDDGVSTDFTGSERVLEPGSTSNYASYAYCTIFTAQNSGQVQFQFKAGNASHAADVGLFSIVLLQLNTPGAELIEGQDYWMIEDATATTLGTSPQTFANRTITSDIDTTTNHYTNRISGESWAYWGHTAINYNHGSYQCNTNLVLGSNTVSASQEPEDPNEVSCDWLQQAEDFGAVASVASSITASDENASAANQYISSHLVALRIETFAAFHLNQDLTDETTTSTDWADNLTGSFTPSTSGKVIAIGTSIYDGNSTGRSIYQKLLIDTASHFGTAMDNTGVGTTRDGTDELPYQFATVISGSDDTEFDYAWQFKKGESANTGVEDRCLVMFTPELAGHRVAWDGSFSDSLDAAANWNIGSVPTKEDDVIFGSGLKATANSPASGSLTAKRVFFGKQYDQPFGTTTIPLDITCTLIAINSPKSIIAAKLVTNVDCLVSSVMNMNNGLYLATAGNCRNLYLLNCKEPVTVEDGMNLHNVFLFADDSLNNQQLNRGRGNESTKLTVGDIESTGTMRLEGNCVVTVDGSVADTEAVGPCSLTLKDLDGDEVSTITLANGAAVNFQGPTITGILTNYGGLFDCSDNTNSQITFGSNLLGWGGYFNFAAGIDSVNATSFASTTTQINNSSVNGPQGATLVLGS